jgi:Gpi18-like mannosyltransferase
MSLSFSIAKKGSLKKQSFRFYKFLLNNELCLAVTIVLFIIIVGTLIGLENNKIIAVNPSQLVHYTSTNPLKFLANWDGVRYISIAQHGYTSSSLTNFLPLYPLLIFLVQKVLGSYLISSLIISWTCLVGAVYFYLKIIKNYFRISNNLDAIGAVFLFLLFPSGIYLLASYTESLFAFLSLGSIYFALRKKYLPASLLAMLATASHINGLFLLCFVLLILIEEKEKIRNLVIALIIGSLGMVSYMSYLWAKFNNPIEFIDAQKSHGWLQGTLLNHLGSFGAVNYIFFGLILCSVVYWWSKRKSFAIYSALYLLIPIIGGQFGGYPRYALMVFPVQFWIFGYFRDKKFAYQLILITLVIGWTYMTLQYAAGYIVS